MNNRIYLLYKRDKTTDDFIESVHGWTDDLYTAKLWRESSHMYEFRFFEDITDNRILPGAKF